MRLTFLGTGTSFGVPQIGCDCAVCRSTDPHDKRTRSGAVVEAGDARILIDTPPELRLQLLTAGIHQIDAVIYTHEHADHIHGIDDLRPLAIVQRQRIPVYADRMTSELLMMRFGYCFETPAGSSYPPILKMNHLKPGVMTSVSGPGGTIEAMPFRMVHGDIDTLGFRFGSIAYAPDVSEMPEESLRYLEGLDVLILDALRYTPHPTHFSVSEALDFIGKVKPKRAVLTNLHTDLDYETLRRELPAHIEPAFDGWQIEMV